MFPPFHQQMVMFLQIITPLASANITCPAVGAHPLANVVATHVRPQRDKHTHKHTHTHAHAPGVAKEY
jgi:hypothetical protein